MTEPNADELRRVYAQLFAMRQNLDQVSYEPDANRYHEQLDRLDRAGYDVAEFRLDPERDMFKQVRSSNSITGEKTYAKYKVIDAGVLESKLDAILLYFRLADSKEPIGFAAPRKR